MAPSKKAGKWTNVFFLGLSGFITANLNLTKSFTIAFPSLVEVTLSALYIYNAVILFTTFDFPVVGSIAPEE